MKVPIFLSIFGIPFTIQRVDPSVDSEAGDDEEEENKGNEDETLVVDSEDGEMPLLYNLCGAKEHPVDSELSELQQKISSKWWKISLRQWFQRNEEKERSNEEKKLDGENIPFNTHLVVKKFVLRETDDEQKEQKADIEKQQFNLD